MTTLLPGGGRAVNLVSHGLLVEAAVKPVSQGLLVGGGGNLGGCGRNVGGLNVCGDSGCSIVTVVPCNLAGAARCVVSVVSSS